MIEKGNQKVTERTAHVEVCLDIAAQGRGQAEAPFYNTHASGFATRLDKERHKALRQNWDFKKRARL